MLSVLSVLLAFIASVFSPPMQDPATDASWRLRQLPAAVAHEVDVAGDVWTFHEDGSESLVGLTPDGLFAASFGVASFTGNPLLKMQGPMGTAPVPTLRAQWVDAQGVTHEVTTPIDSSTPAGVDRALELHEKLVSRLQAKHPPRPV